MTTISYYLALCAIINQLAESIGYIEVIHTMQSNSDFTLATIIVTRIDKSTDTYPNVKVTDIQYLGDSVHLGKVKASAINSRIYSGDYKLTVMGESVEYWLKPNTFYYTEIKHHA